MFSETISLTISITQASSTLLYYSLECQDSKFDSHHGPNCMKIQKFHRVNMKMTKSVVEAILQLAYLLKDTQARFYQVWKPLSITLIFCIKILVNP